MEERIETSLMVTLNIVRAKRHKVPQDFTSSSALLTKDGDQLEI